MGVGHCQNPGSRKVRFPFTGVEKTDTFCLGIFHLVKLTVNDLKQVESQGSKRCSNSFVT